MQVLFDAISSLTGGLINDLTTCMVGMLVIGFICMGIDYLRDVLESGIRSHNQNKHYEKAQIYHANMKAHEDNEVARDYYRAKYRASINKSAGA